MAIKYNKDGLLKKIEKLNSLNNAKVTFGIFGDKAKQTHNNSSLTVGHIAKIHEEGRTIRYPNGALLTFKSRITGEYRTFHIPPGGTVKIPARPFFFSGVVIIKAELWQVMRTQFKLLWSNSNNTDNFLKQIGKLCKDTIQNEIINGKFVKLSDLQIFIKGHDKPLQDSMQLYNSVDYQTKKDMRMKANKVK